MNILSHVTGRVLLFINTDELIPANEIHIPDVLPLIVQRYSFAVAPNLQASWSKILEDGVKFEMGKLKRQDNVEFPIQDFTIYNNGFVVTALSTEIAEVFVQDFFEWGVKTINLRIPLAAFKSKVYLSELVVAFDAAIEDGLERLRALMDAVRDTLAQTYAGEFPPIGVAGLRFDYDKAIAPFAFQGLAMFGFERRPQHRFTENVFYSGAPFRTEDHIRLLKQFEQILIKK